MLEGVGRRFAETNAFDHDALYEVCEQAVAERLQAKNGELRQWLAVLEGESAGHARGAGGAARPTGSYTTSHGRTVPLAPAGTPAGDAIVPSAVEPQSSSSVILLGKSQRQRKKYFAEPTYS